MLIEWTDGPVPPFPAGENGRVVTIRVEDAAIHTAVLPDIFRWSFYRLAQKIAPALAAEGATPAQIVSVTIEAPDPALIRHDLYELDLLYRECLGGNMGRVGLIPGKALAFVVTAHVHPTPSDPVYRGYDRAALNFQYAPRLAVPEAAEIMASWRTCGTRYQAQFATEIQHRPSPKHTSDLYLPAPTQSPAPLHIYIHGGYWQALDKRDNSFLLDSLVQAGIAVATLNYPLAPAATIGQILEICRTAIVDLYNKSAELGVDPNRLTISGHSAGGHLASAIAATRWRNYGATLPSDLIKAAAPLSGVFDLEPLRHTGLNTVLKLSESEAKSWSPLRMRPSPSIPQMVVVGAAESDEFRRQSNEFHRALQDNGISSLYLEIPEANHFTILNALSDSDSALQKAIHRLARDQVI